ncbi:hypothetical protein Syn7502_03068 [Synechococcus sp. PCC 7502]|nr:hypothetical protein Syn7502_03068 [Synechococcus sp. PCC 7502]
MAILDQQGRLFGKLSIVDVGAIAVISVSLVGLFLVPSNTGTSIAQIVTAETKPVEVEIMVRGLTVVDADNLIKAGERPNIIIRNQPRGQVTVKAVKVLVPKIPVPKADGTVNIITDPRLEETYSRDFAVTLGANAKITSDGVILESEKVKVGTPIEIESAKYIMRGSVMAVRY